jgi:hypothetical protein
VSVRRLGLEVATVPVPCPRLVQVGGSPSLGDGAGSAATGEPGPLSPPPRSPPRFRPHPLQPAGCAGAERLRLDLPPPPATASAARRGCLGFVTSRTERVACSDPGLQTPRFTGPRGRLLRASAGLRGRWTRVQASPGALIP